MRHPLGMALVTLVVLGAPPASGEPAPAPRHVLGDVAKLSCRVTKAEVVSADLEASLLTVEVRNGGPTAAEPVTFELRPPAQGKQVVAPRTVRRLPDPVHGRAGRAVGPGATSSYLLAVPLPARGLTKSTMRVTAASFFEGTGTPATPVVVESVTSKRVPDEFGGAVLETTARLRSTSELPVDAVLLARCKSPENARVLLARRVPPRETVTWTFRDVPLAIDTPGAPSVAGGLSVQRLEVVDWSVLTDDGRAEGSAILAEAWRRWVRWEEPFPAVRGRFAYRKKTTAGGAAAPGGPVAGTFRLDGDGTVTTVPDADVPAESAEALRRAIAEAFAPVRRPSPERAVAVGLPSLLERGQVARVRCDAPPSGERGPAEVYEVEGGVILRRSDAEAPQSIQETWTTQKRGEGYVVTGTELRQDALNGGKPSDTARYEYGEVAGRVVPARYVRTTDWTGASPDVTTLDLTDVTLDGVSPLPDVVDAPAEVREAWEGVYRDPVTPVDLTARFVVESGGGEDLWLGERRVSGRLTLHGFTGFRPDPTRWERASLEVEGNLPGEKRRALAALVEDRLMIWAHRSFSARAPFDVAFRGATVRARTGAAGVYDVTNGPCATLRIEDRRLVEWDAPALVGGTIGYARVGATWVANALKRGISQVTARFQDAGGGWLVPVEMRFERIFGPDWGPETVTLSEVRLSAREGK